MTSLGDDFRTDMNISDVQTFLANANTLNKYTTAPLSIQNYLKDATSDDGQAILESTDGLDNWTSAQKYLATELSGKIPPVDPIVRVENGTSIPGLAQLAVNRLSDKAITTLSPTNYDTQTFQRTTIVVYTDNIDPQQLDVLKNEFGVQTLMTSKEKPQGYNVLVTVGSDYNDKQGKKVINEP